MPIPSFAPKQKPGTIADPNTPSCADDDMKSSNADDPIPHPPAARVELVVLHAGNIAIVLETGRCRSANAAFISATSLPAVLTPSATNRSATSPSPSANNCSVTPTATATTRLTLAATGPR